MAPFRRYVAVIDDDASLCRSLARLLQHAGFQAITFESGEQFLADPLRSHFGCLLVDIQLGGMSGIERVCISVNSVCNLKCTYCYFFLKPVTLAFRGLHYGRYGKDAENEQWMNPLFVGYNSYVRGYSPETFSSSECSPSTGTTVEVKMPLRFDAPALLASA